MGVLFKDNAMRFALRLSANSTQPSTYFCLRFPLQSEHGMRRGVFSKYRTNRRRRSYPCRNLALRASSSAGNDQSPIRQKLAHHTPVPR